MTSVAEVQDKVVAKAQAGQEAVVTRVKELTETAKKLSGELNEKASQYVDTAKVNELVDEARGAAEKVIAKSRALVEDTLAKVKKS